MQFLYIRSPIVKIGLGILSVLVSVAAVLYIGVREEARMEAQTLNWEARKIENGAAIFNTNCSTCHGVDGKGLPNVAPALNSHYFFTQRLGDVGWTGSQEDFIALTVAAGRPSRTKSQWSVRMPTWGKVFGGPLRADQVEEVVAFIMNWREEALAQTAEMDPWQCFQDVARPCEEQTVGEAVAAPAAATPAAGPRASQELFTAMGCVGCHNLDQPQTDSSRGPVGPNMGNLTENAARRIPGTGAADYVYNSILHPNDFVVEGYPTGIMPQDFGTRMSEEEIRGLVDWLLSPNR